MVCNNQEIPWLIMLVCAIYILAVPGHALLWLIPDATEAKVVDVCC
jgi:hypothetical protein